MNDLAFVPPEILMGEGGICGFWAMVAIAHVYQRNKKMYGWHNRPSIKANLAAALWPFLPDLSCGAKYVFSAQDMEREQVKQIVGLDPPMFVWPCAVGNLSFY